jgi:GntR family transcriptional regulator
VIVRRHGVGTFVNTQRTLFDSGLERLESLDTLAHRMGLETEMEDLRIEERIASANEARHLEILADSPVISVSRVIKIGERRVAYLVDIVPSDILNVHDLEENFAGSVLDVLIQRGKPVLSHSLTEIAMEDAKNSVAHHLHLRRGEQLLKLTARLHSREGRIVDYSHSYFIPGFFRFHIVRRIDPCDV